MATTTETAFRSHPADAPLRALPIDPTWILEGEPFARASGHGQSGPYETAVWDCTAGRFRWHYERAETICILDGGATVTGPDGVARELRVGDVAVFPPGTWFEWHVPQYVRKLAVLRRGPRLLPPNVLARKVARRLSRALRTARAGVTVPSGGTVRSG